MLGKFAARVLLLLSCFTNASFAADDDFAKPKKGMNTLAALPDYRIEIPKEIKNPKPEYKEVYRSKGSLGSVEAYAWCGKVRIGNKWAPFVVNRTTTGSISTIVVASEDDVGIGKIAWSAMCMRPID